MAGDPFKPTHPVDWERYDERKQQFVDALKRLEEALAQPYDGFMRDSIIQRFEFTYELAWKWMKLFLVSKDILARNALDTLKAAYAQGMIEDAERWSQMHEWRNATSHTYTEAMAQDAYNFIQQHAVSLFTGLWKRVQQMEEISRAT